MCMIFFQKWTFSEKNDNFALKIRPFLSMTHFCFNYERLFSQAQREIVRWISHWTIFETIKKLSKFYQRNKIYSRTLLQKRSTYWNITFGSFWGHFGLFLGHLQVIDDLLTGSPPSKSCLWVGHMGNRNVKLVIDLVTEKSTLVIEASCRTDPNGINHKVEKGVNGSKISNHEIHQIGRDRNKE